jgi:4-amino-4-deoxychorismate lyase
VVYGEHIERIEFIPYVFRGMATVGVVENNRIEYGYKYTDRSLLNALLKQTGCDDMVIIRQGLVTDAFASNLVFESDEGLFTPDTFLLPGTKRQFLLDTGKIAEKRIIADDIPSYCRIRFINAMTDLEDNRCIETEKLKFLS